MRHPAPLPAPFTSGPFPVAEGIRNGLSWDRMRCQDLEAPLWGVRAVRQEHTFMTSVLAVDRIRDTEEAFSHRTAARLQALPLPQPWESGEPVHLSGVTDLSRLRRSGVVAHRGLESRSVVLVDGVPCTHPAVTWADLANELAVEDLVVLGDAVVHRRRGIPLEDLRTVTRSRARRRGVRSMRAALTLIRVGSDSPMETKARILFVRSGLPEPELNVDILDDAGGWLACGDLVWRERRVVAEFDGDHHRVDRRQWQMDVARREAVQAAGWTYLQLTARSVTREPYRHQTVQRLRHLLL